MNGEQNKHFRYRRSFGHEASALQLAVLAAA
jgi:hypothetical protein